MIGPGAAFTGSVILCGVGSVTVAAVPRARRSAIFHAFVLVETLLALAASAMVFAHAPLELELWGVAYFDRMSLSMDNLSALFVLVSAVVFLVSSPNAVTCAPSPGEHRQSGVFFSLYQLLFAAILLVLTANDVLSFVIAWEVMSLLIYALVGLEEEPSPDNKAPYVMLAFSEGGTVAALIGLLLLAGATGSLDFDAFRLAAPELNGATRWAVFLLTFFGFGVKAGVLPVNQWLADAYARAPRAFAPVLAGATANLGIYAMLRINADLVPAQGVGPGLAALVTGSATALVGILYATIQTDVRRVLAHSSIENMGIVVAGFGAALVFAASERPVIAGIALIAALYHLVNHSMYKSLLFIGTGALECSAGSGDMDRLGGLLRGMPWTGLFVLVGVLSISSLPPFNGFVSEWLSLQALLRAAELSSIPVKVVFAISGAVLALTAGLALTCFVKLFAMSFLGIPRSREAAAASETSLATRTPMAVLALLCFLLGVLPTAVIPALDRVVTPIFDASAADALVPPFANPEAVSAGRLSAEFLGEFRELGAQVGENLHPLEGLVVLHRGGARNPVVFAMSTSYGLVVLVLLLATTFWLFRYSTRTRRVVRGPAWDGGMRRLRAGTTYTATGFSNPVRVVFHAVLQPTTAEDTTRAVAAHFRTAIRRHHADVHIVERAVLRPALRSIDRLARLFRGMHAGRVNAYAAYVLIVLVVVISCAVALA